MHKQLSTLLLGFTLASVSVSLQGQPANDNFANRIVLSGTSLSVNGSNVGATREPGEPNPFNSLVASVWYEWTPSLSSTTTVAVTGTFRDVIAIYTGTAVNALSQVAAASAGFNGTSVRVTFTPTAGTPYKLMVAGRTTFGGVGTGEFTLSVTQSTALSVTLTAPANNSYHALGSPITVSANASSGNAAVTQVVFQSQSGPIGTVTTAPYSISWTNAPLGTNQLYAVATDATGQSLASAPITIVVLPPGVYLTAPADGTIYLTTNAITASAVAVGTAGALTNMAFYANGVLFGQDTTSPFSRSWTTVTPGSHRLLAVGTDNTGATYTSPMVAIAVANPLVSSNSIWKYRDDGSDQGTNWVALTFDDSAWGAGPAPLGYGAFDGGRYVLTTNSYGPDANNKYPTTYYRQAFLATNVAAYSNLLLRFQRDDGVIIYLNGVEVARNNMPAGTVTYTSYSAALGDNGSTTFPVTLNPNLLLEGTNVVAAEIHQANASSSDIWWVMELLGVPPIIRNQSPVVALTNPTNNAVFLAPASVSLAATASDPDGAVAKVEFFVDGAKVGEATNSPYAATWSNPALGPHIVTAVATDNQGATQAAAVNVTVFDAAGRPYVQIASPPDGMVAEGPTNLLVTANAIAVDSVTHVQFLNNGAVFASDATPPYSATWNAPFGSNTLVAIAQGANGALGTSAPVRVTITIPPTNTVAPFIVSQSPAADSVVTNLTSVTVLFSERVINVDASDLWVNDNPATAVSGSGSNYTFTFTQPAYGLIYITWAPNHGITDVGWPSNLPFDDDATGSTWSYQLIDRTPPVVTGQTPPAGTTVTNLTQVSVTFSEPVNGVNASDFLVNGSPALGLAGGGANYTFSFAQPGGGPVSISWAAGHGITDTAANAFNATGPGATWTYTLDNRTILVQSNANWMFIKGLAEASTPNDAWRYLAFNDTAWSNAPAPFYYGDPYNSATAPGTLLSDMLGGYSSIYLRNKFHVSGAAGITNLFLVAQSDDGFIAWINGVEVLRYNMPAGNIAYNGEAPSPISEPNNRGAAYIAYTLTNAGLALVEGENVLAVHAFNNQPTSSSDFGFNAQLYAYVVDPSLIPPRIAAVTPPPGSLFILTNLTVRFTEPVGGVEASDLLINGNPATEVTGGSSNTTYVFSFPQPPYGTVNVSWAANHGIADFDETPKPFDGAAPGSTWQYNLLNPSAPTVAAQTPPAGATVSALTQLSVTFSESVSGVNASDLLVNGLPAATVTGAGASYTFTFAQPAYGSVSITWAANHGIQDLENPSNPFDPSRQGSTWSYTLVDLVAPTLASIQPPPGSLVTNLSQVTITFSESVQGVDAFDLLVNGAPAVAVSGGDTIYTFTFAQPNATVINFTWANTHGIRDLAATPNPFNAAAPGATWSYTSPDTLAPSVTQLDPPANVTVRSLPRIRVTFNEPVAGVNASDLLVNNSPALSVSGSGAGPYTFTFLPVGQGQVGVRWALDHGITDLATPPNPFAGGEWTYIIDPDATFAGKVLINEIMFNPSGGLPADEWIELHNVSTQLINLTGWRFTRGVDFTFPNVSILPGGYLVVAASLSAFQARYPGVTNVVGGWTGRLGNRDETLELETALGEVVNRVHYATEGDWARRERGRGAEPVASITRSGSTATVTIFAHGYQNGDTVLISGADQPEYNGRFTIGGITPATFTFTVNGTPATPATGNIVCRQIIHLGSSGWSWFSAADGFGYSLELVNASLPNTAGQNWLSSTNLGGTPGRANSVASPATAPLILDVTHFPAVPRSTDPVAITARLLPSPGNTLQAVQLYYRNHSTTTPGPFVSTNMVDDGAHGDGLANDGLYGAVLPPGTNRTIMEFYVEAVDNATRLRTWPAPTWETNNTFAQLANALYQVDNEVITNPVPAMRLIMTASERAVFPPSNRNSDAEMNTTLVSTDGDGTKIRYLCGVRVRGAGSRSRTPPNNRLNIPNDNRWNGLSAVNLNGQFIHAQLMGAVVGQLAGVMSSDAHIIQYRINGINPVTRLTAPTNPSGDGTGFGAFILVQPVNGDMAADEFPDDADGNVYRASTGAHNADLSYQGTNPTGYLSRGYMKTSNQTENDWSDLMALTYGFTQVPNDADYYQAMSTNLNVEAWMRYFALGSLINYGETSLFNGRGDDYALYRGEKDRRFVPIGHDYDTTFGQGDTTTYYPVLTNASIWIMINPPNANANVNPIRRFMTNAHYAPIFFAELKRLCDTVFSPAQLNPVMDQMLSDWGNGPNAAKIAEMKTYAANRRSEVLRQIPLNLTINTGLASSNGFLYTTASTVTLSGNAHAIDTRRVLVNGQTATWSPWQAAWSIQAGLHPGINRVLVQSLNSNNLEFARATVDIWYDDGSMQGVAGAITANTTWLAAQGPYQVTGNITVNSGVTLTIQAGTTVFLNSGVNITVANGGRLLAEGTETAPIRFDRLPGASASWGGITINGSASSPESRITHAHIAGNGSTAIQSTDGTVFLANLTFGNTGRQYVSLDRSSFVVQDCVFPPTTASFEPVHGSGGIKAGGRGIFLRNYWGRITGYNDALDFTGGNRPGPILQVLNNVFMGSDDDLLDLDSTDAWVEGNIFLHTHRNGSPDSASAVSGGADNADTSQITMLGNIVFDCDQAALAKQGNFYTLLNNTIVHQSRVGSEDTNAAVVILADENTAQGAGIYLEGNLIHDAENLTRNVTTALVTYTNNLIHQLAGAPWTGPGGGNVTADPMLKHIPTVAETSNFTSWAQAQVLWDWLSPRSGSPAIGAGPNGRDYGAPLRRLDADTVQPLHGVSISGEPPARTPLTSATLRVDPLRTGFGIPTNGFPNGSGFTHYKWRLDGGLWSAETPATQPIILNGLASGPHFVEVVGRNDAGFYQDDPVFGPDATVAISRVWTVDPAASVLLINEILASNSGAVPHYGTTPDLIELRNINDAPLDLAGMRLTDDPANPDKFIFPQGTIIPANGYLVLYANNPDGTPGLHLGFNLSQEGEAIYLYDAVDNGGALLDHVVFGMQLTDLSIGRLADGTWGLTLPTFGGPNRPAPLGDPQALRINEWLALATTPYDNDYVELYNTDPLPVALGGLYLSDAIVGWTTRHQMPPLSFIGGHAYLRLIADGNTSAGPDHLAFSLSGDQGCLGLYLPDLSPIDEIYYQPQQPNVAQGRSPNGSSTVVFLGTPTPGAPNPVVTGPAPYGGALVINEVLALNASQTENGRTPDWVELYNGTTNTIDLADLSLSDDALQPRRHVFPPGTLIAPGGRVRVLCDPGAPSAGAFVTTNFALKAAGGAVYLFDSPAAGGSLLNAATYGLQVADLSIGRVPDGSTNWALCTPTPLTANAPLPALGSPANLKINEWMAAPGTGNDDWFEVYNPESLPVAIGGFYLTDDLNNRTKHQVPPLSFLGVGTNAWQKFVADGNTGAGADHVSFSLRAEGEAIGISAANGALIDGVTFGAQLTAVSEGRFPDGAASLVPFPRTASPGAPNWRWLTNVVINEALTHSDPPLEDAIELHNLTSEPVDVGGWWLSDDPGTPLKYQIPAPRVIPPFGFTVIYENVFTNREIAAIPFALSSQGDEIVLSAYAQNALTGYRAKVDFGPAANGVSFGRYLTSDGREEFVAMSARTFGVDDPASVEQFRLGAGRTNAYPKVGPVVITEIMYHPPDLGTNDNTRDEFIELRNLSTTTVALYEGTNGWRLRDAVDYDFPLGTTIPAGGYLLVVGFDPVANPAALAAFRNTYNLDASVPILGPWSGKLANDTDDIELRRPDTPDTNGVPSILVERVRYYDAAPWPIEPDGTGYSLQRRAESEFGNDPANWLAASPNPGPAGLHQDTDGDGMPDAWETTYSLDPFNPADAVFDPDGDGLTNFQEYGAGTHPRNASSTLDLQISGAAVQGNAAAVLTFQGIESRTYSVLYADTLGAPWTALVHLQPLTTSGPITVTNVLPGQATVRFYRVVTPRQP